MECWSIGRTNIHNSYFYITPVLHYSNTPSNTGPLKYPNILEFICDA